MSDDETRTVQEQLGKLAAEFMEFAEERGMVEVTLGGITAAGRTDEDQQIILSRAVVRDPYACLKLWHHAADLEVTTARNDVKAYGQRMAERIDELEAMIIQLGGTLE